MKGSQLEQLGFEDNADGDQIATRACSPSETLKSVLTPKMLTAPVSARAHKEK